MKLKSGFIFRWLNIIFSARQREIWNAYGSKLIGWIGRLIVQHREMKQARQQPIRCRVIRKWQCTVEFGFFNEKEYLMTQV